MPSTLNYIRPFTDIGIGDIAQVGGKNAALGEMYNALKDCGVAVPNGFATTAEAYWNFLDSNELTASISDELKSLQTDDIAALSKSASRIRSWIKSGEIPVALAEELCTAYGELSGNDDVAVAVRSSATAEDLPQASFAGQQDTYLNIRGCGALLESYKHVIASLFTERAIAYREHHGFDHMRVALSAGVQIMVRADKGSAGVMFTLDTESGFRDAVVITGTYGLGENVVQGTVTPDEFVVFKKTLDHARPVIRRQLGDKAQRMVYAEGGSTCNEPVDADARGKFVLNDDEVIELARNAVAIEQYFSNKSTEPRPMDIEWAQDGITGELFILQARPETVHAQNRSSEQKLFTLKQRGDVLSSGQSIGARIDTGTVRLIESAADMDSLRDGEVLVTDITDPDWEPVMKRAAAIVTNRGGRTCHAAIVARELGVPAVVGCGDATQNIATGVEVTVSCAEGRDGYVYAGALPFDCTPIALDQRQPTRTRIMLIIGDPEHAFKIAALPNDGVGLARLEFIISHSIGIHPAALLNYEQLDDALKAKIDRRIRGYADPVSFYVERLAEGVGTIAAAFYPKPVIVRFSDFKTNEYAKLIGGEQYEDKEENPMLGFRGASRYPSEVFADCFALECRAMRKVREDMGLDNLQLMLPFVRSVLEAIEVQTLMAQHGLQRGKNGLKLYLMCEIPSNALCADDFLDHCDGFSIGSNDLTQLTLGVDRDSGLLGDYDERDPSVKKLMAMAIDACKRRGKYIGICGQAPSDFPEITRWLVDLGIDSIALNPDSITAMTQTIAEAEGVENS